MSTTRRGLFGLALGAPALAIKADPLAAAGTDQSAYPDRAALAGATQRRAQHPAGQILSDGAVAYVAQDGAGAIPDLPGLLPFGPVSALHWGVTVDQRRRAAQNARALNQAAAHCRATGERLHLPAGSIFVSDVINVTAISLRGQGTSALQHLPAFDRPQPQTAAPTQIVLSGQGFSLLSLHGISSMQSSGAARRLAQKDGTRDPNWRMISLMNADAVDGAATVAKLAVGLLIEGGSGAHLEGLRVVVDSGGPDGISGYNDGRAAKLFGQIDIGILQIGARNTTLRDVQTLGHFRRYGYLNAAVDRDGDYSDYTAPYETTLTRCSFQGMRAVGLRGPDKFAILDWSAKTVDLPWASDHPFTTDSGHARFRLTSRGSGTEAGTVFDYSRVSRVMVEGQERLRLGGLSNFDPGDFGAVVPAVAGGANSHIVLRDCQIGGLLIPSGHAPNDPALDQPVENDAIGGFEISGWRCAEADLSGRVQHPGSLAGMIHDCREITLDLMTEANAPRNGSAAMRWIVSPQHNQNRHAEAPAGGPRWLDWRNGNVTEHSSSGVDYAPFMPFLPRPAAFAKLDDGWFEGYWSLRAPRLRYYTRAKGTDLNYLPLPALSLGAEAEGYRGRPPQDLLHIRPGENGGGLLIEGQTGAPGLTLRAQQSTLTLGLDPKGARLSLQEGKSAEGRALLRSTGAGDSAGLRTEGSFEATGDLSAGTGIVFPPVARAALLDAGHSINSSGKRAGKAVFEQDGARCLVASGPDPRAPWHLFDGTPAVTPK